MSADRGIALGEAAGPPGMRLYAIGDVHGRLDLLSALHGKIGAEIARDRPADWRIIHVGDYIDRGPCSRGVLDFLIGKSSADERNIALAGNHDLGLLWFLAKPRANTLFTRHGGFQTALSYGVTADFSSNEAARDTACRLDAAIPESHTRFLTGLARSVSFGDFFFCHAGIRPGLALDRQDPEDLIWIRDDFLGWAGLHPKVIVHGHTPVAAPDLRPNHVNIDTGAYSSGILSALVIEGRLTRILQETGGSTAA